MESWRVFDAHGRSGSGASPGNLSLCNDADLFGGKFLPRENSATARLLQPGSQDGSVIEEEPSPGTVDISLFLDAEFAEYLASQNDRLLLRNAMSSEGFVFSLLSTGSTIVDILLQSDDA